MSACVVSLSPKPRAIAMVLAALLLALVTGVLYEHHRNAGQVASGQQLFDANAPLPQLVRGRLAGHDEDLPEAATRCANCHVAGPAANSGDVQAALASDRFGPALNSASLTQLLSRRGGPPSLYDGKAFCKLLREGIDPAWVRVDQTMPQYAATDAQCADMWAYLNRRTP